MPALLKASRTDMRRVQRIPWSMWMSLGGPAINLRRFCGPPKSAELKTPYATQLGCAAASSAISALVSLVGTFSRLQEQSFRSNTKCTAQRIIWSPLVVSAMEDAVRGVDRWTWRSGAAGGKETSLQPSPKVATTVVVCGALTPRVFRGTGSESTASTTSAPASFAPHVMPPRPAHGVVHKSTGPLLPKSRPTTSHGGLETDNFTSKEINNAHGVHTHTKAMHCSATEPRPFP